MITLVGIECPQRANEYKFYPVCRHECVQVENFAEEFVLTPPGGLISDTISAPIESIHTFPKDINPKVKIMAWLEFELAFLKAAVDHFSRYATGNFAAPRLLSVAVNFEKISKWTQYEKFIRRTKTTKELWHSAVFCHLCNQVVRLSVFFGGAGGLSLTDLCT